MLYFVKRLYILLFFPFLMIGCATKFTTYTLEDVEKHRLMFKDGKKNSIDELVSIYQDKNQPYQVRIAAIRALSESRDPIIISSIQSSVKSASLIELDLMKEAVEILVGFDDPSSTDSLIASLKSNEKKTMEIRETIVTAIGQNGTNDKVYTLLELYQVSKTNYARMNSLLANTLGDIGDDKVIPILMEIAKNKNLHITIRNQAVQVLAKKQSPELIDFFVEMIGDPDTRDKVNEYALTVMGELSQERMILALMEAYQTGKHQYYSLLNTIIDSLEDYNNPEIKSVYLEVAQSEGFPSSVRFKALKALTQYSDPEIMAEVIDLLNSPENYVYYNEIIEMLNRYNLYEDYKPKLRNAAFEAMSRERGVIGAYSD